MIYKILITILLVGFFSGKSNGQAQKDIIQREQFWLGYLNQTRFTNQWGMWADVHFRTDNFMSRVSQNICRVGLSYYLYDNVRLTAGYAYIYHFSEKGTNNAHPEHRPWQQLWIRSNYKGLSVIQWLRFEQRYVQKTLNDELIKDYNFNYRFRYNVMLMISFKGAKIQPKKPFFVLQDELFINFGKEIIYNHFDQNRFFVGLGYPINEHLNFQLGYMNVFQQRRSGDTFFDTHTLRLFAFHTLDLRKKEKN
jgi:hypothetical protein